MVCVILFFGNADVSTAHTLPDSTWSLPTVLSDTNQDDTLDYAGQHVRIGGIASSALGQLHTTRLTSAIQSGNYGIPLFNKEMGPHFDIGDSLVVEGYLHNYFGLNEVFVQSYTVYPAVDRSPSPKTFSQIADSPDRYIGMLVTGSGEVIKKGKINNGEYIAISTDHPSGFSPQIFVSNFHSSFTEFDLGVLNVGDEVNVKGILYEHETTDPYTHNYQIYLRTPNDLRYSGLPQYYIILLTGIVGVLILAAGIWITILRRKVNSKTKKIQKSLDEKEILLREIHHRVKNNLSIISGLLGLQIDSSEVEETQKVLKDSQSRIHSLALIHDKLYKTDTLSDIHLDKYIKELVEAIHGTFSEYRDAVELKFNLDAADIDIDNVVPCGLLVNELVVNAFKHAFQQNDKGALEITLLNEGKTAKLTIADNGPGLPEDFGLGSSDSLGSMLIKTFASQLQADMKVDREHDGTAFVFTFPIS